MKLYYAKGACSLSVRILLHELNMPCTYELVSLHKKQTELNEDYFEINPKGTVPALVIDTGELLTESVVILQYLAERKNDLTLLPPKADFRHYRVLEWLNFLTSDLHKNCSVLFNPNIPVELKDSYFKPSLKSKLDFMNHSLEGKAFLVDDHLTIADPYCFVILSWVRLFDISLADWPNLFHYFSMLQKRPAFVASLAEEGITLG